MEELLPAPLGCITVLVLYFVPSIVAWDRKHHQLLAIVILNIFAGWSMVGWVVALVWACTNLGARAQKDV